LILAALIPIRNIRADTGLKKLSVSDLITKALGPSASNPANGEGF
jgi:hypothetical protein